MNENELKKEIQNKSFKKCSPPKKKKNPSPQKSERQKDIKQKFPHQLLYIHFIFFIQQKKKEQSLSQMDIRFIPLDID